MKNKALNILFATALSFGCFAAIAKFAVSKVEEPIIEKVEAAEGNYYSGISDSLTGTSLLNALNSLNNQKRTKTIGYGSHRQYFQYTERCASTPSGKMVGFYNNDLVNATWDNQATWNHEHIWPNSRGGGSNNKGGLTSPFIDADIHMVRPAAQSVNSGRGNLMYAASGAYDPGQYVAEYRGIAARIIFYCAIADTRLKLTENTNDSSANSTMGKLSDLLKWNLQYAPSTSSTASIALQVEQNRNEVIYSRSGLQGNRNPFIDHPEYACKIWGDTNATTRQICGGGGGGTATVTSVTVNPSTVQLNLTDAKTKTLTATVTGTNSPAQTVTWSSSNSNIVSVSNGTITAKAVGTATITATSTVDTTKKGTCSVTVVDGTVPPEPPAPLTLDKTEMKIAVKEQTFLIATVGNEDKITWTIDKAGEKVLHLYKKESVSGEKFYIYSLANGVATLTATSSNGESVSCVITIGTGKVQKAKINTPLVVGLSAGGGTILVAGLVVLIVLLVKKKHV